MADGFKTFPSDVDEALTMLYLQQQDLSETTPERLGAWYDEVKAQIKEARSSGKKPKVRY